MLRNTLIGSMVIFVLMVTYFFLLIPKHSVVDLGPILSGQVMETDLVAPLDFDVLYSDEEMANIEMAARASIPVYLRIDDNVWNMVRSDLRPALESMGYDSSYIRGVLGELEAMYGSGVYSLETVREDYLGHTAVLLSGSGASDHALFDLNEVEDVREVLTGFLLRLDLSEDQLSSITSMLQPNTEPDHEARASSADAAVAGLSHVDTTITQGSIILAAGQAVTPITEEYVRSMRENGSGLEGITQTSAMMLIMAVLMLLCLVYVKELMPDSWESVNRFLLLGVIWGLSLATTGLLWTALRDNQGYPYATMITFGAAMTSIFFHRRHALFFTLVFSLALGLVHPHPFSMVLIASVSGSLAAFAAWDVRRRSSIPSATGFAAAGGLLMYLLLHTLRVTVESSSVLSPVLELLISPVIGIGAASALLFPFEKIFGVYTVLAIDEVNRTDHPLLKRMREEAPGTWNHSLTVAELSGRAASAINAWESLASAGGYYHDIGKMNRPGMFIENQTPGQNPHDSMSPWESASIIISHVRDGAEMAQKAKLPRAVIDILLQHHGTSLTKYFYSKARQEAGDPDSVLESDFRYDGPRPSTIEAAIVMLADQVASATKNLTSPDELEEIVTSVVDGKDLEGELDDCHLTRRNLMTIISVFVSVLKSGFHQRVENYPSGEDG